MKLVYTEHSDPAKVGQEVKVGDKVVLPRGGETVTVDCFRPPHKPSASGRVAVSFPEGGQAEFYVSIIGAKWIEREDQTDEVRVVPQAAVNRTISRMWRETTGG